MSVIFDCRTTFYTEIPACWEEIVVNIGIPVGSYIYKVATPYGRVYQKEVQVGAVAEGFTLLASDFPPSLFNPWIGVFELRMYDTDGCTPISADICTAGYESILIKPVQIVTPPEIIYLVCPCVQEPEV